jgi:F0F1-type ATP synthase assembly protein I
MNRAARRDKPTTKTEMNEVEGAGRFGGALIDIGWRLAATVIVFLWGGNWLDNRLGTKPLFTVIGFVLIIISFVLIVRQVLQKIPKSMGGLKND